MVRVEVVEVMEAEVEGMVHGGGRGGSDVVEVEVEVEGGGQFINCRYWPDPTTP